MSTSESAVTHRVEISGGRQPPRELRSASHLRRRATSRFGGDQSPKRGMWVAYDGRTGILKDLEPGDVATVMLVDDLGCNVLEIHAPAAQLRQAWYEEIPAGRRPDYEHAAAFGYVRAPA